MAEEIDIFSLQKNEKEQAPIREEASAGIRYTTEAIDAIKEVVEPFINDGKSATILTNDKDPDRKKTPYAVKVTQSDITYVYQEKSKEKRTFHIDFKTGALTLNKKQISPNLLKIFQSKIKKLESDIKHKYIEFFDEN